MAPKNRQARGNSNNDDDGDDEDDFSPRQLQVINDTVNGAVTAIVGRKLKPIQDTIAGLGDVVQNAIKEALPHAQGGAPAGGQQQQQQQPGQGGAGGGSPKLEEHPEFIAMKRQLAENNAAREQERVSARNAGRDTRLTELAVAAGVDKHRVRGAVAILREQVKFDKDGHPLMRVKRDGYEEDVDLEAGTGEFFKSDEGKSYLAPQQNQQQRGQQQRGTSAAAVVRGAGGGNQSGASGNAPARDAAANKAEAKQQAREVLRASVIDLVSGGGNVDIG